MLIPMKKTLLELLDMYAPIKRKLKILRPETSWYNPDIQVQKALKGRLERRWRRTHLTVDRELYTQKCVEVYGFI